MNCCENTIPDEYVNCLQQQQDALKSEVTIHYMYLSVNQRDLKAVIWPEG